jgi:nitric oxide reductase large subunit
MLNLKRINRKLFVIGCIVTLIGIIAVGGYIINMPLLYYLVKGFSTAMALHTAILFVILGIGLILLGREG